MTTDFKMPSQRDYSDDILKITNVGAFPGSDAFLVMTKQKAALIDSGFSFCAEKMIENIKGVLGDRPLDYVLLTHSHYDHASGSAYCRAHFKTVQVAASAYAARVFSKPTSIAVIRSMNASAAQVYGYDEFEDKLDDLRVDMTIGEGDIIDLGDVSLHVVEAPGHTKCSTAFYIPQEKMLISCETLGVYAGENQVIPCYLVSYKTTIASLNRVLDMDIDKLLIPHYGIIEGAACKTFLSNAIKSSEHLKDMIISEHRQGKSQAEIIKKFKDMIYTGDIQNVQPEKAFDLNASYLVPMILSECSK